jgi:hypothetical protein
LPVKCPFHARKTLLYGRNAAVNTILTAESHCRLCSADVRPTWQATRRHPSIMHGFATHRVGMRSVVIDPRKRRPFDKLAATADGNVSREPSGAPLSSPDYSMYDRYIDPNGRRLGQSIRGTAA